jgi:hypothetical protein
MSARNAFAVLAAAAAFATVTSGAVADPAPNNPQVQYRSFTCDDGRTYDGGFVSGSSGTFFLVTTTRTFAIKVFTEIFPSGEVKTFNYGVAGFADKQLLTCTYTDPAGVRNIFLGFLTPRV